MATCDFPYVLPRIALQDHDYTIEDVGYEKKLENNPCSHSTNQNQKESLTQQSGRIQNGIPLVNIKNRRSCGPTNPSEVSSFSKHTNCPGSSSICVPVSQSEIQFLGSTEISLCLLSQTGESSSLLTPGWKDGRSRCAQKVKNLIEDFDKHIKDPKHHFSAMEKYIVEIFKIASKAITKDPLSPQRILIEPCILSLRAIAKIYKAGKDFSLPASKYYFMFLLDRFQFIRSEVKKIQAHHHK